MIADHIAVIFIDIIGDFVQLNGGFLWLELGFPWNVNDDDWLVGGVDDCEDCTHVIGRSKELRNKLLEFLIEIKYFLLYHQLPAQAARNTWNNTAL